MSECPWTSQKEPSAGYKNESSRMWFWFWIRWKLNPQRHPQKSSVKWLGMILTQRPHQDEMPLHAENQMWWCRSHQFTSSRLQRCEGCSYSCGSVSRHSSEYPATATHPFQDTQLLSVVWHFTWHDIKKAFVRKTQGLTALCKHFLAIAGILLCELLNDKIEGEFSMYRQCTGGSAFMTSGIWCRHAASYVDTMDFLHEKNNAHTYSTLSLLLKLRMKCW